MIALQPENAQYYTRRGITQAEVGNYQAAIDDFDKAAVITGFDADLHNLLAHAHMHAAFAHLDDDNVGADDTGPTPELAQKVLGHFQKALDLIRGTPKPTVASDFSETTRHVSDSSDRNQAP